MFIDEYRKLRAFVAESIVQIKREYGVNISLDSIMFEDTVVSVKATLSDPSKTNEDTNIFIHSFGEYKDLVLLFYKSIKYCESKFGVKVFIDSLTFKQGKVLIAAVLRDSQEEK